MSAGTASTKPKRKRTYVCPYTCMSIYVHVHICACHICACPYTCMHVHTCACMSIHCMYICMPMHMHVHTHACPYVCMPRHIHAHTHACPYACMPIRVFMPPECLCLLSVYASLERPTESGHADRPPSRGVPRLRESTPSQAARP